MRRQVQVHFENGGQLCWHEEIEKGKEEEFLAESSPHRGTLMLAKDKKTDRFFMFNMEKVTAIIVMSDPKQEDLFERTYAPKERHEQENDQFKYSGDGGQWASPEAGGGRFPFPS